MSPFRPPAERAVSRRTCASSSSRNGAIDRRHGELGTHNRAGEEVVISTRFAQCVEVHMAFDITRERVPSAGPEQRPESQFEFRRLSVSICRLLHDSFQGLAPFDQGPAERGRAEWGRDASERVLRGGLQAIERARLAVLGFSTGVDVLEPEVRLGHGAPDDVEMCRLRIPVDATCGPFRIA